jgi:hypothetical protein
MPAPEMSHDSLVHHGMMLSLSVELINATQRYFTSQDGSADEFTQETVLDEMFRKVSGLPRPAIEELMLCLCSLIVSTTDPRVVQEWIDYQTDEIQKQLRDDDE